MKANKGLLTMVIGGIIFVPAALICFVETDAALTILGHTLSLKVISIPFVAIGALIMNIGLTKRNDKLFSLEKSKEALRAQSDKWEGYIKIAKEICKI